MPDSSHVYHLDNSSSTKDSPALRKKREFSWILYDCANSSYSMAIDAALFPIFYAMAEGANVLNLGYYKSLASLIVALLSPILGTIADYKGKKKKFFTFFNTIGILLSASLAFFDYPDYRFLAIIFILSDITYAGANIFYDAFLVDVTDEDRMDKISSQGFAYGYIASVLPFLLCLLIIQYYGMNNGLGYRLSFLLSAVWWGVLSIPMHRHVEQKYYIDPEPNPIRNSFLRLYETFRDIKKYKVIVIFLLAYFFYIDGVNTIIKMVVPFAQRVLGSDSFNTMILLAILLIIQIIAFPCTLLFSYLAKKYGTLNMVRFAVFVYVCVTVGAIFISNMTHVFILGSLVGFAQGGIQALSRSYFAKIIPKEKSNEFFGFYNIFGKFAAIMGPFIMSLIDSVSPNPRLTLIGVILLFIIGFLISLKLPQEKSEIVE